MKIPVRPYRFEELPKISRRAAAVARLLRRSFGRRAGPALTRWWSRFVDAAPPPDLGVIVGAARESRGEEVLALAASGGAAILLRGPEASVACLVLDPRIVERLLELLLGTEGPHRAAPVSTVENGLLCYAVAALLDESMPASPWTIDPHGRLPEADRVRGLDGCVLEASCRLGGAPGLCWLALPAPVLRALHTAGSASARDLPSHRLGRLRGLSALVPVELLRFELDLEALDSLEAGDILLPPGAPRPGGRLPARLRVGEAVHAVLLEGERLEVTSPMTLGGGLMTQPTTPTPAAQQRELAARLPLTIAVELGRLELSCAELLELEPGDVLSLERAVGSPVDLRVGDRLVARAELVDIEGEAGLRLLEIFEG
jgi:type III secretion protein Q